jgi:hypothetical protein
LKTKIFYTTLENAAAYYKAAVVAVKSKFVGLAPDPKSVGQSGQHNGD